MKEFGQNFEKAIVSKEKFISELKYYRHDCIDDLPSEEVSMNDSNYYKYKCRGNYFNSLVGILRFMLKVKMIDDQDVINKINDFIKHACDEIDFSKFVTKEEINRTNKFLDEVIDYLS